MKTEKKLKLQLGIMLSIFIFSLSIRVNAASADSMFTFWTEDNIETAVEKNGDSHRILFSAKDLKSDYGYVRLKGYFDKRITKSGAYELLKEGIKISVSIETLSPIYISLELEDSDGNLLLLKEDAVWGQKKEEALYLLPFQERKFEVKQSAEGSIYIPMNCFEENDMFQWDKLSAYCVSFVIAKGNNIALELGKMEYLTFEENVLHSLSDSKILGQAELELPVNGDAIAEYRVSDRAFSLRLKEKVQGVYLQDNILKVGKEAKEGYVTIEAVNTSNVILQKTVALVEPLRNTAEYLPDFPGPEEVETIKIPAEGLWQKGVFAAIRIAAGIIIIALVIVYFIFYPKARKEQKEEI